LGSQIFWGLGIGDWGLGIGDWGLGIGPNPHFLILNILIKLLNTQLKVILYSQFKYSIKKLI